MKMSIAQHRRLYIKTAQNNIGTHLARIRDVGDKRCQRRARRIKGNTHSDTSCSWETHKYQLLTSEQLLSSGWETPKFILCTSPSHTLLLFFGLCFYVAKWQHNWILLRNPVLYNDAKWSLESWTWTGFIVCTLRRWNTFWTLNNGRGCVRQKRQFQMLSLSN